MDSPTELGPIQIKQFSVDGSTFRFAAHHQGSAQELDGFVKDVEKIVRTEGSIFGEYPRYEPGYYTFVADYLPYANGDGMEHRNSTVITSSGSIGANRRSLLSTVAHEFFHCWNVERIRPQSLEPFDFERANMSAELWLAEGFTQYYGPLALSRSGIESLSGTLTTLGDLVRTVALEPGRLVRSPQEMSQMAPFTDRGQPVDPTNWSNTYISYYPYGGAIALALDLTLRERSAGRLSLDDFMRAMWRVHGKPGGSRPGYVDHPYTLADAEERLVEVSGDRQFAREFFQRYVHGRELPDYARLFGAAGIVLQKQAAGRAWWGDVQIEMHGGGRIAAAPPANSPAYTAGLDVGDELKSIDGVAITNASVPLDVIVRRKPGDVITVSYVDRTRQTKTARITLEEDPSFELVPIESIGGTLTDAQRRFRRDWLTGD
jgi:predicted metalloprotease with PDZ domain